MTTLKFSDLSAQAWGKYQIFTDPLTHALQTSGIRLDYVSSQRDEAYQLNRGLFSGQTDTHQPSLQVRTILDSPEFNPSCYFIVTHDLVRQNGGLQVIAGVQSVGSGPSCAKLFSLKPKLTKLVASQAALPSPQAIADFLASLPFDFQLLESAKTAVAASGTNSTKSHEEGSSRISADESQKPQNEGCNSSHAPLIAALIALIGQAWIGPKRRIREDIEYRISGRREKWDKMSVAQLLKQDFFKAPALRQMHLPADLKAKEELVSNHLNGDNTLFLAGPAESGKTSLIDKLALDRKSTDKKLIRLNIGLLFEGHDREKEFETGLKPARCILEKDPTIRLVVAIPDLDPEEDKDEIRFYRQIIRELPGLIVEATPETCDLLIKRARRAVRIDMTTVSHPPKSPSPSHLSLVPDSNSASGRK
jgi:hypothetical protein